MKQTQRIKREHRRKQRGGCFLNLDYLQHHPWPSKIEGKYHLGCRHCDAHGTVYGYCTPDSLTTGWIGCPKCGGRGVSKKAYHIRATQRSKRWKKKHL